VTPKNEPRKHGSVDSLPLGEDCPQHITRLLNRLLWCDATGDCVFNHQLDLARDTRVLGYVPTWACPMHKFRNSTREPALFQVECPRYRNARWAAPGLHTECPHCLWTDNPFQYRKSQWRHSRLAKDDIYHSTSHRCWYAIGSGGNGDATHSVAEGFFVPP